MPRLYDPEEELAIGARIRRARIAKQLTITQLAANVDISTQQLNKYELGLNRLSITVMRKIAAALNVNPCELCGCCNA